MTAATATLLSGLSHDIQLLQETMKALHTRLNQFATMTPASATAFTPSVLYERTDHEDDSKEHIQSMLDGLSSRLDKLEATFAAVYGSRSVTVAGGCGLCHNFSSNHLRRTSQYDLYWASSSGCAVCVTALLAEGVDVNAVSSRFQWTALDFMLWGQQEQSAGRATCVGHDFKGVRDLLLMAGARRSLRG